MNPVPPTIAGDAPTLPPAGPLPVESTAAEGAVGDYELEGEIARGGMGVVFRARQVSLNRIVALKMVLSGQFAGTTDRQRFKAEAEAAAGLDHPHVLPIYEIGEFEGRPFFSMKLIEGGSLAQELTAPHRPVRDLISILARVARAVHYAHQRGILHRDLKPANILLDQQRQPYVTDFGLAKKVEGDSNLTQSGAIMGTPGYMAPEQARGDRQISTAVDVYALGAILFEIIAGRPPFQAGSVLETLRQVTDHEAPDPRSIRPDADRDLSVIALKCLAKDPARRYGSADALADDLDRWQRGEPILARPTGSIERVWKWAKRRPAAAALVAVVLVAVVAVIGVFVTFNARLRTALKNEADHAAEAEKQARIARDNEHETRLTLYAADMNLAQQALDGHNVARVLRFLNRQIPHGDQDDLRGFEWHYMWRRCHDYRSSMRLSPGHYPVAFSSDGKRLIATDALVGMSGGAAKSAFLYDPQASKPIAEIPPVEGCEFARIQFVGNMIVRIDTSATSASVLSAQANARPEGEIQKATWHIRRYDAVTGKFIDAASTELSADMTQYSACATPDGNGLLLMENRTLYNSQAIARLAEKGGPRNDAPMSQTIFHVWDRGTKAVRNFSVLGFSSVPSLPVTRGPDEIVIPGIEGPKTIGDAMKLFMAKRTMTQDMVPAALIWNVRTGQELRRITGAGMDRLFATVGVSPDASTMVVAGTDKVLRFHDLTTGVERESRPGDGVMMAMVYSADGQQLAVGAGSFIKVYPTAPGSAPKVYLGHSAGITALAFTADGLVSADESGAVIHWDLARSSEPLVIPSSLRPERMAFMPDGRELLVSHSSGPIAGKMLRVYDLATGAALPDAGLPRQSATAVVDDPSGPWVLLSAQRGEKPRLWNPKTNEYFDAKVGQSDYLPVLSPDGRRYCAMDKSSIRVVDIRTGALLQKWDIQIGFYGAAFAPDLKHLLITDGTGKLHVFNIDDGSAVHPLNEPIHRFDLSSDGRWLIYVPRTHARDVVLWDMQEKKVIRTFPGNPGDVRDLVLSPDGKRLAAVCLDNNRPVELRLWDVTSGLELISLPCSYTQPTALAFSPDGRFLVGLTFKSEILIWDARPK